VNYCRLSFDACTSGGAAIFGKNLAKREFLDATTLADTPTEAGSRLVSEVVLPKNRINGEPSGRLPALQSLWFHHKNQPKNIDIPSG
jgi:hypothetical protein